MQRIAIINQENKVVNVTHWDKVSAWKPPEGCTIVDIADDSHAGRTDHYDQKTGEFYRNLKHIGKTIPD